MESKETWQVAGNSAEVYERHLVPALFEPWAELLIAKANLRAGDSVLDIACGTGVAARKAAVAVGPSGLVTGLDLNAGMLDVAQLYAPSSGAPIDWKEGDAGELPFTENQFDTILCQCGLMFFPDKARALREMRRVLKPNGQILLLVWRSIMHSPGPNAIAVALDEIGVPEGSANMRAPFMFGDETSLLRELMAAAGFSDVLIRSDVRMVRFDSPDSYVNRYVGGSPLASHIEKCSDEQKSTFMRRVRDALQPYYYEGELAFPIEGHVMIAKN